MTNPRGTKRSTLAGIRADRKKAEQRQKAKERADSKAVRKKYKNKKKPKQNMVLLAIAINIDTGVVSYGEN